MPAAMVRIGTVRIEPPPPRRPSEIPIRIERARTMAITAPLLQGGCHL